MYILFMLFTLNGYPATATQEFNTKEQCQAASLWYQQTYNEVKTYGYTQVACIKK